MGVARYAGERIARTEVSHLCNQAALDGYRAAGIEEYAFLATLDTRTSELCAALDGKRFRVADEAPGVNYPPMHPNCRSTTIPYFPPDEFDDYGEGGPLRAARGMDGKTYHVPANMKYEQWKEKYVDSIANDGRINVSKKDDRSVDVHSIGKIDINIYKVVTSDITTDEVIITDTQIQHIKDRHPNDYERFAEYIPKILETPDYILEANKPDTAFILKRIFENNEHFQLILRLKTSNDPEGFKNSVITFLKISDNKYAKYLRNKTVLYKSE